MYRAAGTPLVESETTGCLGQVQPLLPRFYILKRFRTLLQRPSLSVQFDQPVRVISWRTSAWLMLAQCVMQHATSLRNEVQAFKVVRTALRTKDK